MGRRTSGFDRLVAAVADSSMKIGDVRIADGDAHVVIPKLKADFNARIETQGEGDGAKIVVDAKGTYAAQPITGQLVGGALLSLRDAAHPWPVDLTWRMARRGWRWTGRSRIHWPSRG